MAIRCFKCGEVYVISELNTKIFGTYVETICPFCYATFHDKLLNLADRQTYIHEKIPARYIKACRMIRLAEEVENNALDEFAEKKKLKKKSKKVEK